MRTTQGDKILEEGRRRGWKSDYATMGACMHLLGPDKVYKTQVVASSA